MHTCHVYACIGTVSAYTQLCYTGKLQTCDYFQESTQRLIYLSSHIIQHKFECCMLYGALVVTMDMLRHLINCRIIIIIIIIIIITQQNHDVTGGV